MKSLYNFLKHCHSELVSESQRYYFYKTAILLPLLFLTTFTACVKVDDEEVNTDKIKLKEGKWTQIANLKVAKTLLFSGRKNEGSRTKEQECLDRFFFDLDTGKEVPPEEAFTDKWDFSLKLYDGREFYINYQSDIIGSCRWVGSQEPMLGTLVAEDFEKVTQAPDPKEYQYNTARRVNGEVIRKDAIQFGWVAQDQRKRAPIGYYYKTAIDEKGSADIIGYNPIIQIVPKRTFILRTTKGKWAKLQIQGIYKDAPVEATAESEPGYLTFRYYVQQDGSRNLDTR